MGSPSAPSLPPQKTEAIQMAVVRLPDTLAVTENQLRMIEDAKIHLLRSESATVTLSDQNRSE
jgi:hypothetical protein